MADLTADPAGDAPVRRAPLPAGALMAGGLLFGLAGDLLLNGSAGPGLNVFLLFIALAAAVLVVSRRAGRGLSHEALTWLALGLVCGTGLVLRGSEELQFAAFLAAAAAFAFPALRAGAAWTRGSGVSHYLEAIAGAIAYSGLGALRTGIDAAARASAASLAGPGVGGYTRRQVAAAIFRGFLIALPLLLVFGALFMSADRVFATIVTDFVLVDLGALAEHAIVVGVLGWLACGYLTGFVVGTDPSRLLEGRLPRPTLGIGEVATVLALIDLLFLAFVLVQFRYLFGGAGLVEVTPGLTYAEYAREGFGQLAFAAALVLPTLLGADWLLRRVRDRDQRVFRALGGVQLVLLVVVIASALHRVRLYQEAYGLTQARFYGAAFLAWLVLVTAWFAATVLRRQRERFAFPALLSAYALLALLFVANPDVRIARTNLERVVSLETGAGPVTEPRSSSGDQGARADAGIDVAFLGRLSADAVPTLLEALPTLPANARCVLAGTLLRRWGVSAPRDWRSLNWATARARRLVLARTEELGAMRGTADTCSPG
jgi:hypothetical protein